MKTSIYFPTSLYSKLKHIAERQEKTVAAVIRDILALELDARGY